MAYPPLLLLLLPLLLLLLLLSQISVHDCNPNMACLNYDDDDNTDDDDDDAHALRKECA